MIWKIQSILKEYILVELDFRLLGEASYVWDIVTCARTIPKIKDYYARRDLNNSDSI